MAIKPQNGQALIELLVAFAIITSFAFFVYTAGKELIHRQEAHRFSQRKM